MRAIAHFAERIDNRGNYTLQGKEVQESFGRTTVSG